MEDSAQQFVIKILNKSGPQQHYTLFAERAKQGVSNDQVWLSALQSLTAPLGAWGRFTISREYAAICGTSSGAMNEGAVAEVLSSVPITLGIKSSDGTITHGTALKMVVVDNTPQFDTKTSEYPHESSFLIETPAFDEQLALKNHWIIGMGTRPSTSGDINIILSVPPKPQAKHEIFETRTFYVVAGKFDAGKLVGVKELGECFVVDFNIKPSSVSILHDENGKMQFQ